jgi:hypothetical protein
MRSGWGVSCELQGCNQVTYKLSGVLDEEDRNVVADDIMDALVGPTGRVSKRKVAWPLGQAHKRTAGKIVSMMIKWHSGFTYQSLGHL